MTPATMPGISLAAVPDQFDGAVGFTVAEGSDWTGALAALDAACGGAIKRTAEAAGFDGSKGKTLLVLGAGESAPARVVLTGLGSDAPSRPEVSLKIFLLPIMRNKKSSVEF